MEEYFELGRKGRERGRERGHDPSVRGLRGYEIFEWGGRYQRKDSLVGEAVIDLRNRVDEWEYRQLPVMLPYKICVCKRL